MSTTTLETRHVLLSVLRENANPDGTIPNKLVRPAADRLGVSPRQVRRWLCNGVPTRPTFLPTDEHIDALYAAVGNVAATYRLCVDEGLVISNKADPKYGICERQFRRGLNERIDAAILHAAKSGWSGFVNTRAYGTKFAPHKGHTYATDASPLNLLVLDKPGGKVIDLWEMNLLDEFSRFALVVSTTNGHPDTNVAVAVMAAGIGGYQADDGTQLGGMPDHVLSDNGSEYKNQPVTTGLVRLGFKMLAEEEEPVSGGIKRKFSPPESGWVNGVDEAFHKTLQRGFSAKYPGYINPDLPQFERLKQRDYWKANPHLLLTRDQVDALLQRWLMRYNFETVHRGIGMTPFDKWKSDDRLLRLPDPGVMRLAMLSDDTRIVDKGKVRAFSTTYYLPALGEHHGHEVEIRYLPGRTETIEILYLGMHLGTAIRRDLLDASYHGNLMKVRDKQTQVYLAHSLSGERLKTERANKELLGLGFDEDELPHVPTEAQAAKAARSRDRVDKPQTASIEEHELFADVLERSTPTHNNEEFIA